MAKVLVDTSAIYAVMASGDSSHRAAVAVLKRLRKDGDQPFLTNLIVAETHALVLVRLGRDIARRWLVSNRWPVERVTELDEKRTLEILVQYADKDFSYTDASSFAVLERLGLNRAVSFDAHFDQFGVDRVRSR